MSRAAVTYPSKDELRGMTEEQIEGYISSLKLRVRASGGKGSVAKALLKKIAVAEKVLAQIR